MYSVHLRKNDFFIYSKLFQKLIHEHPIILVDVGARAGLDHLWNQIDKNSLSVIGFEPDIEECNRLRENDVNNTYIPKALWSNEGNINFHLAKEPSASSVHPPNFELIKQYEEPHWKARETESTISVPATTLDNVMKTYPGSADFLKVDTQGAEYEILVGSELTLKKQIFCVLVETWTTEVHKGQRLTGDVLSLMADNGFQLFDTNLAAAWRRKTAKCTYHSGKRQIIGLDLLFFKDDFSAILEGGFQKGVKAAAIAEAYGFPDWAIGMLNAVKEFDKKNELDIPGAIECIIRNCKRRGNIMTRIKNNIIRKTRRKIYLNSALLHE